jgi:predicted dehydrogenase
LTVAHAFSRGRGVDAVLLTASTPSHEPVHQAARMCRKRGRIVLVGVTGLELSRADFYEKELTFQVSCSYGPGRYDPHYEEQGQDYPVGFVRWTEQRNFEAVLDLLADGRLDVKPLISHRFAITEAEAAYALVGGAAPSLGILLEYPTAPETSALRQPTVALTPPSPPAPLPRGERGDNQLPPPVRGRVGEGGQSHPPAVSFIGAGNYATAVLMPAFKAAGARLNTVACRNGVSGLHAGRKFGFATTTTDTATVFADPAVAAVVITTRHDSHAGLVLQALAAGQHVFVEKPLCLTREELAAIERVCGEANHPGADAPPLLEKEGKDDPVPPLPRGGAEGGGVLLMVGFNRRFAPQAQKIKALLASVTGPKALVMTVNAGAIPADHWTQNLEVGGGRILGEACHFIDLLRFLVGCPIVAYSRTGMDAATGDTVSLQLEFADGSIGTVHYFANGSKAFPKERLEVFAAGRVLQLDNFRRLTGYGWPGFKKMNLWRQDKGQKACAAAFVRAVAQGGPAPIPLAEILEVSRIAIDLA